MGIQIYGFWRSIASFRVRVALRLKGLPFEETPIDILTGEQFEPGYEAVNAERVVPTFIHDGHSVFQSLAIMEYIEDIKPEPRLVPLDPKQRAYARSLALMTVADAHPLVVPRVRNHLAKAFGADAHAIEQWGRHWTTEGLATYERLLARRPPAPFALGAEPGLADICIAGQIVGAHSSSSTSPHSRSSRNSPSVALRCPPLRPRILSNSRDTRPRMRLVNCV
jgi:maleylacetoacetate isomerase